MLGTLIMPGRDPLAIFSRYAREYGDITFFRLGGERVFFVNHPDLIKQVLVTEHAKVAASEGGVNTSILGCARTDRQPNL